MARTFAEGLSQGLESLQGAAQRRTLAQNNQLDQATKLAALKEAGYGIEQQPRSFLGGGSLTLTQDPNYQGTKQIERQKALLETQKLQQELTGNKPISPADQALIDYRKSKTVTGNTRQLTAGQQLAKDKATTGIFDAVESNKIKRGQITDAEDALKRAPQGMAGKFGFEWNKRFNPNDPSLSDWQKIKMVGTDAQLLNTAKTKGAISDQEMALFSKAAANDDYISAARMKPVLDKIMASLAADENSRFGAYQKNYGEDPKTWFPEDAGTQNQVPAWVPKNYQQNYLEARNAGHSDQEIMDSLKRLGLSGS